MKLRSCCLPSASGLQNWDIPIVLQFLERGKAGVYAGLVLWFSGKIYTIDMEVDIPTYTHSYTQYIHAHIHTYRYTYIYTYTHTYTILIFTHTHAYMDAYIHTYNNASIDTVLPVWHSLTQKGMPSKTRSLCTLTRPLATSVFAKASATKS